MSVLIEAYNVVIQRDTLTRKYPGGLKQYGQDCPNLTYCYDDHLTRIGFMAFDDASAFANRLLQDYHLDALEIAIVVQDRGLLAPREWLEYALHRDGWAMCWLKGSDPTKLAAPAGWSLEQGRALKMRRLDTANTDQHEFVRHEEGMDVYRNRTSGELFYVGRTHPREDPRQPLGKRLFRWFGIG